MVDIPIRFHSTGNGLQLTDAVYGRTELGEGKHRHEVERILSETITITSKNIEERPFFGESKFGVYRAPGLIKLFEINDNNIDLVAEHLVGSLSSLEPEPKLEIDNNFILIDKEKIKEALQKFLKEEGHSPRI